MGGAIPPLPNTPSLRGAQLNLKSWYLTTLKREAGFVHFVMFFGPVLNTLYHRFVTHSIEQASF
jgi:hypothetical protein